MKVPFTWKVTGWFMIGWSAEFGGPRLPGDSSDVPPDPVRAKVERQFLGTVCDDLNIWRYQQYIENPAVSKVDAKPYMAMRKWATQFYEVPPSAPGEVPASV